MDRCTGLSPRHRRGIQDLVSLTISFHGHTLTLDPSGALFVERVSTLIVADMHLEKGSSRAHRGALLPPYDTRQTLHDLGVALETYKPECVVCLGDTFHDGEAGGRVDPADADLLKVMTANRAWIWVSGNHDPDPPDWFGGTVARELEVGGLILRHAARPGPVLAEISGHYHPKATVRTRARTLSRRCFANDGARIVLPAFGAYTGGLNVLDDAMKKLWRRTPDVYVIGGDRIYPVPPSSLRPPPSYVTT